MSRKRDTNWSRDEITVLLDSIMEITSSRGQDNKRTSSREVFEYAAKKLGEQGHATRAEREKCRTKWKKMKEEFTHAKRAREGDTRFKEAPGIIPFYSRMEEFINGNFDNISPHSTIRRNSSSTPKTYSGMRSSARIAANSNGTPSDNAETSSNTSNNTNNTNNLGGDLASTGTSEYPAAIANSTDTTTPTPSSTATTTTTTTTTTTNLSSARQNTRLSNSSNILPINALNGTVGNIVQPNSCNSLPTEQATNTTTTTKNIPSSDDKQDQALQQQPQTSHQQQTQQQQQQQPQQQQPQQQQQQTIAIPNGDHCTIYTYAGGASIGTDHMQVQATERDPDISYRVSTGCRQIIIFGDHDVDIKFRGSCVQINKIDSTDY